MIGGKPYNFKSDVWSFGIIMFYMLAYHLPFCDKHGVIEENWSEEYDSSESMTTIKVEKNEVLKKLKTQANTVEQKILY